MKKKFIFFFKLHNFSARKREYIYILILFIYLLFEFWKKKIQKILYGFQFIFVLRILIFIFWSEKKRKLFSVFFRFLRIEAKIKKKERKSYRISICLFCFSKLKHPEINKHCAALKKKKKRALKLHFKCVCIRLFLPYKLKELWKGMNQ